MRQTFEELIDSYIKKKKGVFFYSHLDKSDWINIMRLVRQKTIEECANYAEAGYNIINTFERAELFREDNIECYVLKESILQLNKNSIEI